MKTPFLVLILTLVFTASSFAVTLDDAFQAALGRQETVRQDRERIVQSRERVNQVRGGILPNIALNATHFMQPKADDPVAAAFFPEKATTVGLGLTQPLFRSFREFAGLRQQKDLLAAQEETARANIQRLYEDTALSVLTIIMTERDLVNLRGQSELYGKRVTELRGRARTGESSANEVLTAQSTQAGLQAEIRIVENQLRAARENFHFLTGLPRESGLTDPNLVANVTLGTVETWFRDVEQRPDLKEAKLRFEAAEEEVSVAKGAHGPSLDLLGNYYLVRPEGYQEDMKWDVTFRLTLPLYEGGATQSRVREAASRRLETDLELARRRRIAEQEIRNAHESLLARLDQIKALESAAELSEKNAGVMQRDYRRGLARNIDVQLALTEARVSRRALDSARVTAQLEYLRLQMASARPPAVVAEAARRQEEGAR